MPLNSQGTTGVRFMMCVLNSRDSFLLCSFQYQYQRLVLHFSGIHVTHAKLGKSDNLSPSIREIILDLPAGHCVTYKALRAISEQYLQGEGKELGTREEEKIDCALNFS